MSLLKNFIAFFNDHVESVVQPRGLLTSSHMPAFMSKNEHITSHNKQKEKYPTNNQPECVKGCAETRDADLHRQENNIVLLNLVINLFKREKEGEIIVFMYICSIQGK